MSQSYNRKSRAKLIEKAYRDYRAKLIEIWSFTKRNKGKVKKPTQASSKKWKSGK